MEISAVVTPSSGAVAASICRGGHYRHHRAVLRALLNAVLLAVLPADLRAVLNAVLSVNK